MIVGCEWKTQRVGELRAKTKHALTGGPFGSNLVSRDYTDEGVPVIRGGNLPDSAPFAFDDLVFVSEKKADALRPNNAFPGDLIFTQRGTLGQIGLIPKESPYPRFIISQSQMKLTVDPEKANARYLYCYFRLPSTVEAIHSLAMSSGVPHINLDILRKFQIITPPLPIQRKIAAIVSAYDELIENNNHRIALLEKMAEEIYREWFVRLRFPGHETLKFVKGMPEGWEVKSISEIVDFLSGYSFKSETYTSSGKYGIVTIKNVQDGFFIPDCTDFIDELPANMKKHCVLTRGDVLMSLTGNVGRVCHVYGSDLLLNQRVAKLESKLKNGSQFVYYTFNSRSMMQLIENLSLGSTAQMNLSPIQLGKQRMIVPDTNLLLKFENIATPLTVMEINLYNQSERLKNIRDSLLPRLISGKLSVENLDIQFPPGMAGEMKTQPIKTSHA